MGAKRTGTLAVLALMAGFAATPRAPAAPVEAGLVEEVSGTAVATSKLD